MARRWLHSLDVEVDEQRQSLAEKALIALGQAIVDGRVRVDASGITIEADIIDLDTEGLILGIGGAGGGTLDGVIAALSSPAQAGEAAEAESDLETFLAALGLATEATLSDAAADLDALTGVDFATDSTLQDILSSLGRYDSSGGLWYYDGYGYRSAAEFLYDIRDDVDDVESALGNPWSSGGLWCYDGYGYRSAAEFLYDIRSYMDDLESAIGYSGSDGGLWYSGASAAQWLSDLYYCVDDLENGIGYSGMDGGLWYGGNSAAYLLDDIRYYVDDLENAVGNSYSDGGLWYNGESAASLIYSTEQDLYDIYSALGGESSEYSLTDICEELFSIEYDLEDVASSVDDVYWALGTPAQEDGGVLDDIAAALESDGSDKVLVRDDGREESKTDWPVLTAPGVTATYELTVRPTAHVLVVTVGNINTNVVVRFEGQIDSGVRWYNMTAADLEITSSGTYVIASSIPAKYVRGVFVSESGGTDANVEFEYYGQR